MAIYRTQEIWPTAEELAEAFANLTDIEQSAFFERVSEISREWPGAGWCQQSYGIAQNILPAGREVIRTLASHVLDREDI